MLSLEQTLFMAGNIVEQGGDDISIANTIQNPEKIYNNGNSWRTNYSYFNLWSMNTTKQQETTNTIIKNHLRS